MPSSSPGHAAITVRLFMCLFPGELLECRGLILFIGEFFYLVPATQEAFKISSVMAIKGRKINVQLGLGL